MDIDKIHKVTPNLANNLQELYISLTLFTQTEDLHELKCLLIKYVIKNIKFHISVEGHNVNAFLLLQSG